MKSLWSPFRWVAPGGANAKLNIFIFHRVLPAPDELAPLEPDVRAFRWMMKFLRRWFTVLPLGEAADRLRSGTLPAASVCITFDDGYADNLTMATPVLEEFGLPATVFVATDYLDGGRMWNDTIIESIRTTPRDRLDLSDLGLGDVALNTLENKRAAIGRLLNQIKYLPLLRRAALAEDIAKRSRARPPSDLMLTRDQLRRLASPLVSIGAHTRRHPILAVESAGTADAEIRGARTDLEACLQSPVDLFAYPNGRPGKDYGPEHVDMVKQAGYRCAVSTAPGAMAGADLWQLPRFTPWARVVPKFAAQLGVHLARPPGTSLSGVSN